MDRQLVSVTQAAERVKVSRRTIYCWLRAGKVQYVRTAGGSVRIYADTLTQECPVWKPLHENNAERLQRTARLQSTDRVCDTESPKMN